MNAPRSGQSFGLSTVFGYKMVYCGHKLLIFRKKKGERGRCLLAFHISVKVVL